MKASRHNYVRTYDQKAEEYAKDEVYNSKAIINQYQPEVGKVLGLFGNNRLDNYRFRKIKQKAFGFIPENILKKITKTIQNDRIDKKEFLWDFHRKNHYTTTTNLRPLFMAIPFNYAAMGAVSENLKPAVHFMTTAFNANKPLSAFNSLDFPTKFIAKEIKKYFLMKLFPKNKKTYETIDPYKYGSFE